MEPGRDSLALKTLGQGGWRGKDAAGLRGSGAYNTPMCTHRCTPMHTPPPVLPPASSCHRQPPAPLPPLRHGLQSPGAFQAQPESPGSKFGVRNPDAISSVRTHVPPSSPLACSHAPEGTGGDGQRPVPLDALILGQWDLLGTQTRQFPGCQAGKIPPKPPPLPKHLVSSGLSPAARGSIAPYRLAVPRRCRLAVDAALEGSPGEALREAPAGSHPPLPLLHRQIQLIYGETGTASAQCPPGQKTPAKPPARGSPRDAGTHLEPRAAAWVPPGLRACGGWVGSSHSPGGPGMARGVRARPGGGAEGAFPIPAPKVTAASGLNGFDYLISLWFNGLDNMLIRYEGCSKMF